MLYVICALKPEAQAFVDKYKLSKTKQNDKITIIVSGIGKENMFSTTKKIVKIMNSKDIILNIGICGGSTKFKIGELIDAREHTLTCRDSEVSINGIYELVDMESAGFIKATLDIENSYIFKVVSDHFEPHKVTKEKTKSLIFNVIDDINHILKL